jgi:Domain of unknown function (DUF4410)
VKSFSRTRLFLFALTVVAGCASTKFTEEVPFSNERLARPNRVWIYNFAAASGEMPPDSSVRGLIGRPLRTPATAQYLGTTRLLGALVARDLVGDIQAMGLSAVQAGPDSSPQVGDAIIRGYFVSAEEGGAVKRFVVGFGYGRTELDTVVEASLMTTQGLHQLGSGTISSSGARTPGLVVPAMVALATGNPLGLIVGSGARIYVEASGRNTLEARAKATANEIAEELRTKFQQRGWITAKPPQNEVNWKRVGSGVGAAANNVLYVPAKLVYALGGLASGAGYALTGGDQRVANTIWQSSLGGDYVITPEMVSGEERVHFSGLASTPR